MIAPCGHICFHWAKCSNNLHVWVKFAKAKIMFVEEMVDCKKTTQLSLGKDFDQSMYSILVKQKLSVKENMIVYLYFPPLPHYWDSIDLATHWIIKETKTERPSFPLVIMR